MSDGRSPESAAFEPSRIGGGPRGRPSVVAAGFVLVLSLVIAAGVSGRLGPGAFPNTGENIALAPSQLASPASSDALPPSLFGPAFPADTGPMLTSGPGDLELLAKRRAETIFVHGDVYAPGVTWVYMSLRDDAGQIAGWASVSVPGAAGPAASGAPSLRFDVELAIPDTFSGRLWVQAHAYDARFGLVATARVDTPVAGP